MRRTRSRSVEFAAHPGNDREIGIDNIAKPLTSRPQVCPQRLEYVDTPVQVGADVVSTVDRRSRQYRVIRGPVATGIRRYRIAYTTAGCAYIGAAGRCRRVVTPPGGLGSRYRLRRRSIRSTRRRRRRRRAYSTSQNYAAPLSANTNTANSNATPGPTGTVVRRATVRMTFGEERIGRDSAAAHETNAPYTTTLDEKTMFIVRSTPR